MFSCENANKLNIQKDKFKNISKITFVSVPLVYFFFKSRVRGLM